MVAGGVVLEDDGRGRVEGRSPVRADAVSYVLSREVLITWRLLSWPYWRRFSLWTMGGGDGWWAGWYFPTHPSDRLFDFLAMVLTAAPWVALVVFLVWGLA